MSEAGCQLLKRQLDLQLKLWSTFSNVKHQMRKLNSCWQENTLNTQNWHPDHVWRKPDPEEQLLHCPSTHSTVHKRNLWKMRKLQWNQSSGNNVDRYLTASSKRSTLSWNLILLSPYQIKHQRCQTVYHWRKSCKAWSTTMKMSSWISANHLLTASKYNLPQLWSWTFSQFLHVRGVRFQFMLV